MMSSSVGCLLVAGEPIQFGGRIKHLFTLIRMIVYSPQFIENYQLKSGEGLSIAFVVTWLVGDLANFIGAILAQLIPTLVLLAVYVRRIRPYDYRSHSHLP